jgi:hypothetical protein
MMPNPNQDFDPFFVVGAPRSGTTLLTVMLDRHDAIVMTPETKIFRDMPSDWRRREGQNHEELIHSFRYWTHLVDLNLEACEVLARFRYCEATYPNYVRCVLECYRERYRKPRIGEKSPEHMWDVPLILEWYPKAKIVWLLRDGRDAVVSINRFFGRGFRRASFFWRQFALLGQRWERIYAGQVLCVRFEDLVLRPTETVGSLCSFLGLKYQEQMLDTNIGTATIPDHEMSHKQRSLGLLDPGKVGEYKRVTTDPQRWVMASVMEPVLTRLGYPPIEAASCPWPVRLKNALLNVFWSVVYHPSLTLLTGRSRLRVYLGEIWNTFSCVYRRGGRSGAARPEVRARPSFQGRNV